MPEPAWNMQPKRASQILEDGRRKVLQSDGGGNAGKKFGCLSSQHRAESDPDIRIWILEGGNRI